MARTALTAEELEKLLGDLARRLHELGQRGRLLLVGGAAMSLGYSRRRLTLDVDADYEPRQLVTEIVQEMAHELGLRDDWLNANAVAFMPPLPADQDRQVLVEHPGLVVELASPRVLLAMKMAAFRAVDRSDLEVLFAELGITAPEQAVRITRDLYGEHSGVLRDDADDDLRLQAEEILDRLARR